MIEFGGRIFGIVRPERKNVPSCQFPCGHWTDLGASVKRPITPCSQKTWSLFIEICCCCCCSCPQLCVLLWNLAFSPSWRHSRCWLWDGIGAVTKSCPEPKTESRVSFSIMWGYQSHAHSICQQCWDYSSGQWTSSLGLLTPTSFLQDFSKEWIGLQGELALGCFDGWSGSLGSSDHQRWLRWWSVSPLTPFWAVNWRGSKAQEMDLCRWWEEWPTAKLIAFLGLFSHFRA